MLTCKECEDLSGQGFLGCYYAKDGNYHLVSREGKACNFDSFYVYPVIYFDVETSIAIMEIDKYNAVAISYADPDFVFLDIRPSKILN